MRKGTISIWVVCFLIIAFAVVVNRPTATVPINSELVLEGSGIYDNDYYVGEQNQILMVRILDTDSGGDITDFWCNISTTDPAINFTDHTGNMGDLPYDSTPLFDDYLWDPTVTWNYFKFTFDINNSATPGEHYVTLKFDYINSAAVLRMGVIFDIKIIIGSLTKTLYVGGTGLGNYTHIQYAIENASDGDTVFVFDDSAPYYENVEVNKTINLIGEDMNNTIIDGGGILDVVLISVDWVNITGFTITNCGNEYNDAGLKITSNFNSVSGNNIFSNQERGIQLDGAFFNNISENIFLNNSIGVYSWWGHKNKIKNNYIFGNQVGIGFWAGRWNTVIGNSIVGNNLGFSKDSDSYGNEIYHNNFIGNINQSWDQGDDDWDDGAEGNYWDDYNGIDGDFNGIGDTPYIIDEDSKDNYPLMYIYPDTSAPSINLHSPKNNSVVKAGTIINLSVSDSNLKEVEYSINDNVYSSITSPYDIATETWQDGFYSIKVRASDTSGKKNSSEYYIEIDSTKPAIIITSRDNNSVIKSGTILSYAIIDINLLQVNYSINDESNTSLSEPFDISTTSWPDGEYTIQINAMDKAGNKDTKWYFFILDSTPPNIAEIMVTLFPMESFSYVNISVNASDSAQIYDIWVNITDPNGITFGNFSMNYDPYTGLYYINQTCEFFGEYQLVIWANDTVGNWISNTGYFDVFTLPGAPTNLTATAGDGYIVITWCGPVSNGGSPITIYRIYRGKISGNVTFLTEVYNSSHYIDTDIIEGETYYYKVRAVTTIGVGPMSNEASATCKEKSQPDEGLPWWLWIIIAIVIALIIIFIIYMIFSKKMEQQPPSQLQYPSESQIIERKPPQYQQKNLPPPTNSPNKFKTK